MVESWLYPAEHGLYCAAGDFYIDPHLPVERAIITHGHADHARPGHSHVLATPETVRIMQVRLGEDAAGRFQALGCGETIRINAVDVSLAPAGHVTGSAQVVITHAGKQV